MTQLTEFGREILPHLKSMLDASEAATAIACTRRKSGPLNLRIGLGSGIGAACISPAVRKVTASLSDVNVHFNQSDPPTLIEAMLTDTLDCALLPDDCHTPAHLNRWPLYTESAVIVLPAGHRLAYAEAIVGRDLMQETLLIGNRCGGFGEHFVKMCGLPVRMQRCHGDTAQMLDLVSAGLGVALLSERLRFAAPLVVRKLSRPELSRRIILVAVAGRQLNRAAAQFIQICKTETFL